MTELIGRGGTITLDALFRDANWQAIDADTGTELVSVIDALGATAVANDTPTHIGTGHYEYAYPVDIAAPLGAWEIHWSGLINGAPVTAVEGFTVLPAGSITIPTKTGHGGGPCTDWVTLGEVQADPRAKTQDGVPLDDALLARKIEVAQQVLYALSGRRYAGECSDIVRPTARWYAGHPGPLSIYPASWGRGITYTTRNPHRDDGSTVPTEISLGVYPIRHITEVRIDGVTLDASAYRVDDLRWLRRIDGDGWPVSQDMNADPAFALNTFQVIVEYGEAPPTAGVEACKAYAIELAKGSSGDPCNLPERVLSMQMQSISYAVLDPMDFLDKGRTGVYEVDVWLRTVNPTGAQRGARVYSPDRPRPVRRTGIMPSS